MNFAVTDTAAMAETAAPRSNVAHRAVFRFVVLYLALYLYPYVFDAFHLAAAAFKIWDGFWNAVVPWVGAHILHLNRSIPAFRAGGDSVPDFIRIFCCLILSVVGAIVWTALDKGRKDHRQLHDWFRVYIRYSLAIIMLNYGAMKVFDSQFPFPSLATLTGTVGDLAGRGLLWTFMGYSRAYTIFGGAGEILGAMLLFFRRTTTLGALILTAVLANVVMLNFSYDVGVKQLSLHLLLVSIFLLAPDMQRLARLLILHKPTSPADIRQPFSVPWKRAVRRAAKFVFVGSAVFTATQAWRQKESPRKPPLYGIWEVEEFVRNGHVAPPLTTDSDRWRVAIFNGPPYAGLYVRRMNDSTQIYEEEYNEARSTVTISADGSKNVLSYARSDPENLTLEGTVGNEALIIKLKRIDESRLRFVRREFRLVR